MIYEPNQCPFRFGLGVFGDRWSLLIIRDMMFRGYTRFQDFMDSGEGISTNILSSRLRQLEAQQIISRQRDPANGRQVLYDLTERGRDLLPVMLAVIGWAEKHDPATNVFSEFAERIRTDLPTARDQMLVVMEQSRSDPDAPLPVTLIADAPPTRHVRESAGNAHTSEGHNPDAGTGGLVLKAITADQTR